METQSQLFERFREPLATLPPAPHNNTDTSREAAAAIAPELNRLENIVVEILETAGPLGLTNEEIVDRTAGAGRPMTVQTVSARINRLSQEEIGMVRDSGRRRRTRSGRRAAVRVLVSDYMPPNDLDHSDDLSHLDK